VRFQPCRIRYASGQLESEAVPLPWLGLNPNAAVHSLYGALDDGQTDAAFGIR
jgi:hypothetical protein